MKKENSIDCLFGSIEEHLRERQYLSVSDTKIDLGQDMMYVSGICVYLPKFHVTVHEGFICHCEEESSEFEPKYAVTAILDKKSGELLYDEEADFLECVYHWLKEKIPITELEKERCSVEGIEVREHGKSIPIGRSGRSRQ